ncbi:AP-5 complex subunit sigma-1 isoform X1 [Pleurodeles waltl]|uniref:AP-5 complex subunit sigma-1 isoform X1 n=1 Tax=Pleurodeles waltl TaxID=8319 RepID=UPI00370966CE
MLPGFRLLEGQEGSVYSQGSVSSQRGEELGSALEAGDITMVHGFLIHTLGSGLDGSQTLCRVLYSRTFSFETFDDQAEDKREHVPERERLRRKEQILTVAREWRWWSSPFGFGVQWHTWVQTSCALLRQASGKPVVESAQQPPPDESFSLQDADFGVFGLSPGDPFHDQKTVLWMGVLSIGFALICDADENLVLAENTLRMLVRFLVDALKLLNQSSDVVLKADKAEILLNTFLPHGQLLFLNHQFIQSLEKELCPSIPK